MSSNLSRGVAARYAGQSFSRPDLCNPNHRWKVLGAGVAANVSFSAAAAGIPTTAVFMRTGYHLGNAELGLALSMLGLGVALTELPWGLLTDRWGDRPVLLTGLCATAVALALMAWFAVPASAHIPGLTLLALGLLSVGLLGGSVNGASGRAVMAWFREGERGLAMSIRQTAVPLGGGLGALVLPWLASEHGFLPVYGVLALFCAVSACLAWFWLHEPPLAAAPARSAGTGIAAFTEGGPLRDAQVWRVVIAIGVLCMPQFAILAFGTVFLHDFRHAGIATITAAMVSVQVGATVMRVWSGRWTDRKGNRRGYLQTCTRLSALAFVLLTAIVACTRGNSSPLMTAAVAGMLVLAGICVSAWHGVAYTELATLAGAHRAGTALGMANTCVYAGLFLTPLAIPHILVRGSWSTVWLAAAVCACVALPFFPKAR